MNSQKMIDHWRDGALEDWEVAEELWKKKRVRHALFLAELSVEKALKAHVIKSTGELAPKTHDLLKLARLSGVQCSEEKLAFFGKIQRYCLEGRYEEDTLRLADPLHIAENFEGMKETLKWLIDPFRKSSEDISGR